MFHVAYIRPVKVRLLPHPHRHSLSQHALFLISQSVLSVFRKSQSRYTGLSVLPSEVRFDLFLSFSARE
jgi:hypothetical protein